MGPVKQTAATLRVIGDKLDPSEITRLLGKQPTRAWAKGDTVGERAIGQTGIWTLRTARMSPGDLEVQILDILAGMTDDLSIWKVLASKYNVNLFAGLFLTEGNEGLCLSPQTLKMLSDRHIELQLDIYYEPDDDHDQSI